MTASQERSTVQVDQAAIGASEVGEDGRSAVEPTDDDAAEDAPGGPAATTAVGRAVDAEVRSADCPSEDDGAIDVASSDPVLIGLAMVTEQVAALTRTIVDLSSQIDLTNRRNHAQEAIIERLQDAEQQLRAATVHPFALALIRVLTTVEAMEIDDDVRQGLRFEIEEALTQQGYELFGGTGEDFDVRRHEALAGRIQNGVGVVETLYSQGLSSYGKIVVKARVSVVPPTEDLTETTPGAPSP